MPDSFEGSASVRLAVAAEWIGAADFDRLARRLGYLSRAVCDLRRPPAEIETGRALEWQVRVRELTGQVKNMVRGEALWVCADVHLLTAARGWLTPQSKVICARRLVEQRDGDRAVQSLVRDSQIRIGGHLEVSMCVTDGLSVIFDPRLPNGKDVAFVSSPHIAGILQHIFGLLWQESVPVQSPVPPGGLTTAQWRIFRLLALGLDDAAMATATGTAIKTVRAHVAAILMALEAPTRFAAAAKASARGWLSW